MEMLSRLERTETSLLVPLNFLAVGISMYFCWTLPVLEFHAAFTVCKTENVSHKYPRQDVHCHATTLDDELWPGWDQLAVQHGAAHEYSHNDKQKNKQDVHQVAQECIVAARVLQKPAGLQQRVGDFAAKDHGAGLDAWLTQPQGQQNTQNAHGVVGKHYQTLSLEVHTPSHVKDEVAKTEHHRCDLERGVLGAWKLFSNKKGFKKFIKK